MHNMYAQFLLYPTKACAVFLFIYWAFIFTSIKISNIIAHRRFSDGPSLIPVFPILPVFMLAIAAAINAMFLPFGTVAVVVTHIAYPIWRLWKMRRNAENNNYA